MPEEKGQKPADEKLQYLRREEIRTMGKDVAALREEEAREERQRISGIRAKEESKREAERQEKARRESQKRAEAAWEARKKEKDLARMRTEREERERTMAAEEKEKAAETRETLRERLGEAPSGEEEARRRFLERVEVKAEGKEEAAPPLIIPKAPAPPRPPVPPKPEVPRPEPPKVLEEIKPPPRPIAPEPPPRKEEPLPPALYRIPTEKTSVQKLWIRVVLSLLVLAILAAIGTFWYWYFVAREETPGQEPQKIQEEEVIPEQSPQGPAEEPAGETPEQPSQPEITAPKINEMLLGFGYNIPDTPRTIDTIIIHSVYNALGGDIYSLDGILEEYELYGVTAHYLIERDGTIYQTAPTEAIAYHAGQSQMPDGRTAVNNFSVGIELVNSEEDSPTEAQYQSLASLVKYLREEYVIPSSNILGHKDVAPDRKTDPWNFDWQHFDSLIE